MGLWLGVAILAWSVMPAEGAQPRPKPHPFPGALHFLFGRDNPLFPLEPGTTFVYTATTSFGTEARTVVVTHRTKRILGVMCMLVEDTTRLNGELVEVTTDYYAPDDRGNVWYFGEDAKQYEGGVIIGTEGSWRAGFRGAQPGIVMLADPLEGDTYRQEFARGIAEDMARVFSEGASATVPLGTFPDCMETEEFSPLDPGVVEHKFYAWGIGEILTIDEDGVRTELVSVTTDF